MKNSSLAGKDGYASQLKYTLYLVKPVQMPLYCKATAHKAGQYKWPPYQLLHPLQMKKPV